MRPLLVLGCLLAVTPPALAQDHEHAAGPGVVILHDLAPDGHTFVGNVNHFGVIVYGEDGVPAFHQQMHIRATLNGVVVYETTPDTGHDYDGVNTFDVVFPVPGSYAIEVLDDEAHEEATLDVDDADREMAGVLATFGGTVAVPDEVVPATVLLEGPAGAMGGELVTFTFSAIDASGAVVPHSDAVIEARDAMGNLHFRTKTHTHEDAQSVAIAFPGTGGPFTVTATAFKAQPGKGPVFLPATTSLELDVMPGPPMPATPDETTLLAPDTITGCARPVLCNRVVAGETSGEYELLGTFDPWVYVGPFTQQHLFALVVDPATMQPVQHVDFAARLVGPRGAVVFESASLHEYDGVLEVTTRNTVPGPYTLVVDASRGNWTGHLEQQFVVLPPVVALAAGPQLVETTGQDGVAAGVPASIEFFAHDVADRPFAHGEIDLQVLDTATGLPVLAAKLHTHDDGRFPVTINFPAAGDYVLRLSPFPLEADPTPVFFGATLGEPLDVPVSVADGPGIPPGVPAADEALGATADDESGLPGPAPLLLVGALVVAVLATRRRA